MAANCVNIEKYMIYGFSKVMEQVDVDSNENYSKTNKNPTRSRVRGNSFDDAETFHLLNIWASEEMQRSFKIKKHNLVFAQITKLHCETKIYNRSIEDQHKIKNLKAQYRSLKPTSGASPPTWAFYAVIHQVLGQQDSNRDDLLDDSFTAEFSQPQDSQANSQRHEYRDCGLDGGTNEDECFEDQLENVEHFTNVRLKKIKR